MHGGGRMTRQDQPNDRGFRHDSAFVQEMQPMLEANKRGSQGSAVISVTRKFGGLWKFFFFTAAATTVAAGIIGIIACTYEAMDLFMWVNQVYVLLIGLFLMVLDFPDVANTSTINFAQKIRFAVQKYMMFLTRFTGRGAAYLFLSTIVISVLWNNNVEPILGFVFGGYIALVGIICIASGLQRSVRLNKCRSVIKKQVEDNKGREYFNLICPKTGLTGEQFTELIVQIIGEKFTEEDIGYVMNALSQRFTRSREAILTPIEFEDWVMSGGFTIL